MVAASAPIAQSTKKTNALKFYSRNTESISWGRWRINRGRWYWRSFSTHTYRASLFVINAFMTFLASSQIKFSFDLNIFICFVSVGSKKFSFRPKYWQYRLSCRLSIWPFWWLTKSRKSFASVWGWGGLVESLYTGYWVGSFVIGKEASMIWKSRFIFGAIGSVKAAIPHNRSCWARRFSHFWRSISGERAATNIASHLTKA